jgi:hypothetical protein
VEVQDEPSQRRFGRPLAGPTWVVLSPGSYQVGPQGGFGCPRGLEAVWTRRWAIGSM